MIDGWIVKFFPYDKKGQRNNLKQLEGTDSLPDDIVKVDLKYQEVYNNTVTETPLELWAGFVGHISDKHLSPAGYGYLLPTSPCYRHDFGTVLHKSPYVLP